MNEYELRAFVFSETVKIIAALITKGAPYGTAYSYFDQIYNDLLDKAVAKQLEKI